MAYHGRDKAAIDASAAAPGNEKREVKIIKMKKLYLCYPYSHKSVIIRWWRYIKGTQLTARVMVKNPGLCVFSPITHSHSVSLFMGNGLSHDFWLKQDFAYLDGWADILGVPVQVPGWEKSKGIGLEVEKFNGPITPVLNDGLLLYNPNKD